MTIQELAAEYSRSADLVYRRIRELERVMKAADDGERLRLDGRLRPLWAIYRDTREVARYLERNYGTKEERHETGLL